VRADSRGKAHTEPQRKGGCFLWGVISVVKSLRKRDEHRVGKKNRKQLGRQENGEPL